MGPTTITDLIHEALHADPFRPFAILMRDGRTYPVAGPDRALMALNRWAVAVVSNEGVFTLLALSAVAGIEYPTHPEAGA